jgi:hypothetical protein
MSLHSKLHEFSVATLRKMGLYGLLSVHRIGPLYEDGWFRSVREMASIGRDGEPLPWITYPAIEFINSRLSSGMKVFEFGCGYSTLWWAKRVQEVRSVEHDSHWYEAMRKRVPENVGLVLRDEGAGYVTAPSEWHGYFDIAVVDGRDRVNCLVNCLPALKETGVIILDDSERGEYAEGIEFLKRRGFRQINFVGFAPIVNYKKETSVLYRNGNCLDI